MAFWMMSAMPTTKLRVLIATREAPHLTSARASSHVLPRAMSATSSAGSCLEYMPGGKADHIGMKLVVNDKGRKHVWLREACKAPHDTDHLRCELEGETKHLGQERGTTSSCAVHKQHMRADVFARCLQ